MANTKSAKKAIRQTLAKTKRNKSVKSNLNTCARKLKLAVENKEEQEMSTLASKYVSVAEKAAKRDIIHFNKVKRIKANVAQFLKFKKAEEKPAAKTEPAKEASAEQTPAESAPKAESTPSEN